MISKSRFYRDSRNGKFMGVCAGISDYVGIDALWVRVATVLLVIFGVPFIIIAYLAIGFIAPVKPAEFYDEPEEEREFWRNVRTRPRATAQDVRGRFRDMERRLRNMEAHATSKTHRLNREIDKLRDA